MFQLYHEPGTSILRNLLAHNKKPPTTFKATYSVVHSRQSPTTFKATYSVLRNP